MSALPTHVVTDVEPIPAPSRDPFDLNLPDMRRAVPIEQMIEWLQALDEDAVSYLALWRNLLSSIGNSVSLSIDRDGERHLMVGGPVDEQIRHRSRWQHFLFKHMDADGGERRELLLRTLEDEGHYSDNRPADPRATTRALRAFLGSRGRILIDPQGKLTESNGVPAEFIEGSAGSWAQFLDANHQYFTARRRWRSDRQIKRAVSMLGKRTENGWLVLEARP